jgi:hypothetical protein
MNRQSHVACRESKSPVQLSSLKSVTVGTDKEKLTPETTTRVGSDLPLATSDW